MIQIKPEYELRPDWGLVAILDRRVCEDPAVLIGRVAEVRTPEGRGLWLRIDDARDHLVSSSVFFGGLTPDEVPIGSTVTIRETSDTIGKPTSGE
ncbi:MAG: hypothetical protein ACRC33_04665 [Gemmataceae bacterium]